MTAKERVIASRLVLKIDAKSGYAENIGLSYKLKSGSSEAAIPNLINNKEKANNHI